MDLKQTFEKLYGKPEVPYTQVLNRGIADVLATNQNDIVSFGYPWLDDQLTGIFPGQLILIGGETGIGKSTFALNILKKASKTRKCAVFALEERIEDLGKKAIYYEIGQVRKSEGKKNYPWNSYARGELNENMKFHEYAYKAFENLKNDNLVFQEVENKMTFEDLEKYMEKLAMQGVELFLIDHLHYFDLLAGKNSKADFIEQIMTKLHLLITKHKMRVILVAHYRKLGGSKPGLDSFKDSISIVQNSDTVINIWRNREENISEEDKKKTTFSIPKTRNPNGEATIEVKFDPLTYDYAPVENWRNGSMSPYETQNLKLD